MNMMTSVVARKNFFDLINRVAYGIPLWLQRVFYSFFLMAYPFYPPWWLCPNQNEKTT